LSAIERLVQDAATLGVTLTSEDADRLLTLTAELARWNRSYNLTAISAPAAMVTHHLLDSLAVHPDLSGRRIADAGTGAGFPGLPLALCNRQRHFTLIDATAKKVRFVAHAAGRLNLTNVVAVHARVESMKPEEPFDTVLARAFAPIPTLLQKVTPLCGPQTQVLAMKGKWPKEELAALESPWHVVRTRELNIPGLDAARCLVVLARSAPAAAAPAGVS
jgi:16S rRNA (guanine527-N7)-methyltransferase